MDEKIKCNYNMYIHKYTHTRAHDVVCAGDIFQAGDVLSRGHKEP